ncbi:nuclear pore complex protein Nup50 [Lampris incognitus]|uniref:nuclear pore complex protein Nup50 n=1 Tax=Lampris incognitus TaxID=2546036 RepID=UPI0024B60958|nr:nuclear pore complex protein Nup50 [Lampris incognitus]XP_056132060.1 nuclear pore complex protein Nup50 [Lampris incognitus]XP_056132061.1 nuclear pore complex protein Nup50 [Lampris incognitus]
MAKRIADKELTDRNWDQEDEGEEAGTFSLASEDVLKNRAIKKAKRRNVGAESETNGAFKGFKGFSMNSSTATGGTPPTFSGFGNGAPPVLTNGNNTTASFGGFSSTAPAATPRSTFNGSTSAKPTSDITINQTNGSTPSLTQSSISCSSSGSGNKEYSRQLTALNCSVRDWITKHVNDNPLCDLNPIFRDYERHLASIEKKYGGAAGESATVVDGGSSSKTPGERQRGQLPASTTAVPSFSSSSTTGTVTAPTPASALFSFGKEKGDSPQDKGGAAPVPAGITFNFGQKVDSSALGSLGAGASPSSFSFSAKPSSSQGSLFGASASTVPPVPFSFSGAKAEAAQPADQNEDEESEEPPKPEVREIKEKDAFYSKKCKLFYKKDSEFKEKGTGTLHLKQMPDGKTQMIVRADTNLGNILLNIIVPASMPCSRMGKNNIMVVCVPNPPVDDKNLNSPTPLLIRVKTAEDADELHKIIEEKKV